MNDIHYDRVVLRPEHYDQPMFGHSSNRELNEIAVEIGFGNGEYTVHLAERSGNTLVVGIELSLACIMKLLKKVSRANHDNVKILKGDARFLLRECFENNSIDRIHMNFPCPWPKKRHIKRRVTNPEFMDTVAGVLKKGSIFEVITDECWYADAIIESAEDHVALSVVSYERNPCRDLRTKYERKWLEEGKDIYLIRIKKRSYHAVKRLLQGVEKDMHSKLEGSRISLKSLQLMEGKGSGEDKINFVFKDSYTDAEGVFLLGCISSDDEFEQSFYFRIVNNAEGTMIKLDPNTPVFRTPSVKRALGFLTERLRENAQK